MLLFQLKKEIIDAHNELRICYDKLRLANDNRATKVEPLDPDQELESGCLTSFVQSFKDVVDDMIKVQKKNSVSRKNSVSHKRIMIGWINAAFILFAFL